MQTVALHPGIHLSTGHAPQYPLATFQGPSEHTGHPTPQADYQVLQARYPGPQGAYSMPQTSYTGPPVGYAGFYPAGLSVQNNQVMALAETPWMPAPPPPLNCPPGLEYLSQIDQIQVHQQVELEEVLSGFITNKRYELKNSLGQRVYFAVEDNDWCTRNCYGGARPFTLKILDNLGREVITMHRPLRCSSCCFPCSLQEIEIQAPSGVPVGYVRQTWHPCLPKFTLQNERKEDVLRVIGPYLDCTCYSDVDFEIKSLNEESIVGKISRYSSGSLKRAFLGTGNFGIQFPLDLDVKMKTVMLGACFLIVVRTKIRNVALEYESTARKREVCLLKRLNGISMVLFFFLTFLTSVQIKLSLMKHYMYNSASSDGAYINYTKSQDMHIYPYTFLKYSL